MLIAFLHYNHIDPSIEQIVKFYYPLLWILLSIIYDLFGLIITYLCYQTGLRMVRKKIDDFFCSRLCKRYFFCL